MIAQLPGRVNCTLSCLYLQLKCYNIEIQNAMLMLRSIWTLDNLNRKYFNFWIKDICLAFSWWHVQGNAGSEVTLLNYKAARGADSRPAAQIIAPIWSDSPVCFMSHLTLTLLRSKLAQCAQVVCGNISRSGSASE